MQKYKADLHIHTVLSPCADLEMTPANIVKKAKEKGLQIIGITDHNSTKNAKLVKQLAKNEGVFVLTGTEITTREEVHCLAFFEYDYQLDEFQIYLDENITIIPNPDGHFGYQPVVDENEDIVEMIPNYLPAALKTSINEIQQKVYELNGIFIPAHIDKHSNGIFSQLGFIPAGLKFDAMGVSVNSTEKYVREHYVVENKISLIHNSDAHFMSQIGEVFSMFYMENSCFKEVKKALNQNDNRFVEFV